MVNMFYDTNPVQHFAKIETWALEAFPAKTPTANSRSPVERQSCQWEQYHDGSMTVWSNLSFLVSSAAAQSWSQNLSNLKVETTIQYTINIGFLCLNMFCSFYLLIITDWIHVYIYIRMYIMYIYFLFSIWNHTFPPLQPLLTTTKLSLLHQRHHSRPFQCSLLYLFLLEPGYDTVFSDMIDANWLSYWYTIVKLNKSRWHSSHVLVLY